jgi:hypothetical protein
MGTKLWIISCFLLDNAVYNCCPECTREIHHSRDIGQRILILAFLPEKDYKDRYQVDCSQNNQIKSFAAPFYSQEAQQADIVSQNAVNYSERPG